MALPHHDKIARMLDYHLRLDGACERLETQQLLSEDRELQSIGEQVERMLRPLATWVDEDPPVGLGERTFRRVRHARQARELFNSPLQRPNWPLGRDDGRARWMFNNFRDLVLVAASVMFVVALSRPAMIRMREVAQQQACAFQMRQVYTGLGQYAGDHADQLPFLPRPENATWWRTTPHQVQSGSNTRNLFVLVREGYLPVRLFVCPAKRDEQGCCQVDFSPETLKGMHDFAERAQVHYSLRLSRRQGPVRLADMGKQALLADQNPVFADFDPDRRQSLDVSGCSELLQQNSPNHAGRGQNLLAGDGAVEFLSDRRVGPGNDDVFTIRDCRVYYGHETPAGPDDIFIAP